MRNWYLVMRLTEWQDVALSAGGFPASIRPSADPSEPFAFVPVFKTKRAALKYAKGADIVAIRPTEAFVQSSEEVASV